MKTIIAASCLALALASTASAQQENKPETEYFQVRAGYQVTIVATLPDARLLEFGDDGTLYCSRLNRGDIIAFQDKDGDGIYETRADFVTGYPWIHGMSFHDGWLWFAHTGSVHRARDTNGDLKADDIKDVIPPDILPRGGTHLWRSLLVTRDGLFTSIGDSENISDQSKTERQKIWHFSLEG